MTFELALRYGIQRMKQKGYNRYQWQPATVFLGPKQSRSLQAFNEYFYFYYPCPCNEPHFLTDDEFLQLMAEDTLRGITNGQINYHTTNGVFAPDLSTLGLAINEDTVPGYTFSISLPVPGLALALATSLNPSLPSLTYAIAWYSSSYYRERGISLVAGGPSPEPDFTAGIFTWPAESSALLPNILLRADPINTKPLGEVRIDSDHNTVVLNRLGMDNIEFTGNLTFTNHTLKTQELFFLRFTPLCKQHGYARADHD